jgi:hypothetical protein
VYIDDARYPDLTAEDYRKLLNNPRDRDPVLFQALGKPDAVVPTLGLVPVPDHLKLDPGDLQKYYWRYGAERYVHLSYPAGSDATAMAALLKRSGRFRSVEVRKPTPAPFSATPTDPLWSNQSVLSVPYNNAAWPFTMLKFPQAWDLTKGHATVGIVDSGIYAPGGVVHPDLVDNFRRHLSLATVDTTTFAPYIMDDQVNAPGVSGHGTHIAGLIGAKHNNVGLAGACSGCSIIAGKFSPAGGFNAGGNIPDAYMTVINQGAQVINRSGATNPQGPTGDDQCNSLVGSNNAICPLLAKARDRDAITVVSAGNYNYVFPGFPADQANVIAVGAVDQYKQRWSPTTVGISPPSTSVCGSGADQSECGSNYGFGVATFAPGVLVLSSFSDGVWSPGRCQYNSLISGNYGLCTGTSMSAPLVSGIAALARSANPLLSNYEFKGLLAESNIPGVGFDVTTGIAQADTVVRRALGALPNSTNSALCDVSGSNCKVLNNRLTPMFHLAHNNRQAASDAVTCQPLQNGPVQGTARPRDPAPAPKAQLFTTNQQVAAAAMFNELYVSAYETWPVAPCPPPQSWAATMVADIPTVRQFESVSSEIVANTAQQISLIQSRASFFLFTTEQSVGGATMLPLYRLSFDSPWPAEVGINDQADLCPGMGRDYAYANNLSNAGIVSLLTTDFCPLIPGTQSYRVDGIEGYTMATCPATLCTTARPYAQWPIQLYLRGDSFAATAADRNWALVMNTAPLPVASRPPLAAVLANHFFALANGEANLGYVFPNTDSDGDFLINGQEWLIGTDPLNKDTDLDFTDDGEEFPAFGLTVSNPRVRLTEEIFGNGFE